MDLPPISGLRAGLLPHREWAVSRWFYANPIWYYHRRSTVHEIRATGRFFQLVDPELREVCRLLNEAGIRTTPSCQGHSYPRDRFERIWEELRREEGPIRGPGLTVKDSENDQPYLFREPAYALPWSSFEDFFGEASAHQNVGYLGILIPKTLSAVDRRFRADGYGSAIARVSEDEELGQLLGGALFDVRVESPDPKVREAEWRHFTHYVATLLNA